MDAKTDELRAAHDVLAEPYAKHLAGALERMPIDQAVLGLFCRSVLEIGTSVADIGCGTGHLEPYLASQGLDPRGVDLSPGMIEVARRDQPAFDFEVADVRALPFDDASLSGVVCWYSLMYLAPADRPRAFGELARVVRPGGYLVTGFKAGDGAVRRGGRTAKLGVGFRRLLDGAGRDEPARRASRVRDGVLGRAAGRRVRGAAAGLPAGRKGGLIAAPSSSRHSGVLMRQSAPG